MSHVTSVFHTLCFTTFLCIILLLSSDSIANDADNNAASEDPIEYQPSFFFKPSDASIFSVETKEPLKRIHNEGVDSYMTQDGDIFDEDIATLEAPLYQGALSQKFSFSRSKVTLAKEVYHDHKVAFYSHCRIRQYAKKWVPVLSSCGYKPRKNETRAKRIEWEHIVPAWVFGHQLQCWQQGGRANCRSNNQQFRQMEADMHNLVPAIGEINGDRSNYRYRILEGEERPYGEPVNMEVDFKQRSVEPPDEHFGDIARIYFYMRDRYGFKLSKQDTQLLTAWNNLDPVDEWEKTRNQRINKIQGNENPYVSHYRTLENYEQETTPTSPPVLNESDFQGSLIDKLYWQVYQKREELPYTLVIIITILFLLYRRWRAPKK